VLRVCVASAHRRDCIARQRGPEVCEEEGLTDGERAASQQQGELQSIVWNMYAQLASWTSIISMEQQLPKRRVLATTILRKFNKQWRIVCHHAQRITSSPYTGDQVSSPSRTNSRVKPQQQGRLTAGVLRGNEIRAAGEAVSCLQ